MKTDTKPTKNTAELGNKSKPLLPVVNLTGAQKRLKKYMEDSINYWVYYERYGCYTYYLVEQKGVGVIDKIQQRTYDKAIELGIITHEQYRIHQQLG